MTFFRRFMINSYTLIPNLRLFLRYIAYFKSYGAFCKNSENFHPILKTSNISRNFKNFRRQMNLKSILSRKELFLCVYINIQKFYDEKNLGRGVFFLTKWGTKSSGKKKHLTLPNEICEIEKFAYAAKLGDVYSP